MDKEEARFILRCFRPDGSDVSDPSFAEALRLAAEDRELGEWLARERSSDAEFTEALARLELPVTLRDEILAGLAAERGDIPNADEWDASLIGALALVQPPDGLRNEILVAMNRSGGRSTARRSWTNWLGRFGLPLAAAAGIVVALMINSDPRDRPSETVSVPPGAIQEVSTLEEKLIAILEDDFQVDLKGPDIGVDPKKEGYALDLKDPQHEELFRMVREELKRACPQGCVPKGLREFPGIGCKKLLIDGKRGAIVCFKWNGNDEPVHLAVFIRDEIEDTFPIPEDRTFKQFGNWAVAEWKEKGRAFVLLGTTNTTRLGEVF